MCPPCNYFPSDIIYLDYCKAFNCVTHFTLLKKMKTLGIGGKLIQWIRNFLSRRTQMVRVDGELSEPEPFCLRSSAGVGSQPGSFSYIHAGPWD